MTQRYRNWHIDYDPPPIPTRNCDWQYWHDDYDGAEDAGDNRCGFAESLDAAKAEIDRWYDEEFECPRCRDASPDSCLALVCPDRVDWRSPIGASPARGPSHRLAEPNPPSPTEGEKL